MSAVAQTKGQVIEHLLQAKVQTRSLGVRRIALFGSFVRGRVRPDSDVDLLVEFEPGQKSFDHFMALSFFLEDLFHRSVENVTTETLSPFIGPHILAEAEDVLRAA